MLKCATVEQNETLDRITFLFRDSGILFTLVGGAACREYGLERPTKDLDFVVKPFRQQPLEAPLSKTDPIE